MIGDPCTRTCNQDDQQTGSFEQTFESFSDAFLPRAAWLPTPTHGGHVFARVLVRSTAEPGLGLAAGSEIVLGTACMPNRLSSWPRDESRSRFERV